MPEPTSPQFDDLWTATYSPSGPRHNPNPEVAQRIYNNRQGYERYGNRTNELSELGRVHVDNAVNRLASYGGGHGQTGTEIAGILRDNRYEVYPTDSDDMRAFLLDQHDQPVLGYGGINPTENQISAAADREREREASPFTAVSGQDEVWNRIMGRDRDDDGEAAEDYSEEYDEGVSDTHSGLLEDEWDYEDMNTVGPNYDEPDPFDRSNPVEARQARAIEDMNETLGE